MKFNDEEVFYFLGSYYFYSFSFLPIWDCQSIFKVFNVG